MKYSQGYKFIICSHDTLLKDGWILNAGGISYSHVSFSKCVILKSMIKQCYGEILTVERETSSRWYTVKENNWEWPVATFAWPVATFGKEILETDHECVEGMTPINGWFICKTCGTNLEEIK